MDRDSMLKAYVMKAAAYEELSFSEDDIVPLEFGARTDMGTGEYFDIQYVIFERPSKRSVWKCSSIGENEYNFSVISISGDGVVITGHIE
jgi:hypothetical protein